MNAVDVLRHQSELAYSELTTVLEGVTQPQAWAVLPHGGPDYLHSDASIHGIVHHLASCKRMYASVSFRGSAVRWRDCAEEVAVFEPDWERALVYHQAAHAFWVESWASLTDADLEREVPTIYDKPWPVWRVVLNMAHHDSYHAGQIAVLRYACPESNVAPPSVAEDIRTYCADSPYW